MSETPRLEVIKVVHNAVRCPMPASRRAKQFQPFDALRGFKEAIAATERYMEPKIELADFRIEEINSKLMSLKKGQVIIVTYYNDIKMKYVQLTGCVVRINPFWGAIQVGEEVIDFTEIYDIKAMTVSGEM